MRTAQLLISTQKETPADAEVVSHQLMLRAGMIRKLAAGLYTWLPLGLRVLRKVEAIVREEMNHAGAQEVLMPAVQPAELWQESGRWDQMGAEMLRMKDRHQRDFCIGPTHEEVITDWVRNEIKSYKQLPANFYQLQTKFRDERRPRFGVMRAREFLMKDAYSFHISQESLQATYEVMHQAYSRIFTRIGLNFRPVMADTGAIGGSGSHEFHVLADSGEDAIAFSSESDYAANIEMAAAIAPTQPRPAASQQMQIVDTPNQHSIEALSHFLKVSPQQCLKTLIVRDSEGQILAQQAHNISRHPKCRARIQGKVGDRHQDRGGGEKTEKDHPSPVIPQKRKSVCLGGLLHGSAFNRTALEGEETPGTFLNEKNDRHQNQDLGQHRAGERFQELVDDAQTEAADEGPPEIADAAEDHHHEAVDNVGLAQVGRDVVRSEEHTSELQSH